ncbi:MAG: carboxypeptidase-like regulatory domain-containing protein [Pirellulales bacterium]
MCRSYGARRLVGGVRLCSLLAMLMIGCAKGGNTDTVAVSGKVTYNGQPVEGATVTFASTDSGTPGAGMTAADGSYKLTVKPGSYAAMVSKFEVPVISPEQPSAEVEPKQLLPAKYRSPTESPLKFEVKKGDANVFDLPLTD